MCTVSSSERPACPQRSLRCRQELKTLYVYECFGGGTVGPADGGWLTLRFVKQLMGVLVNERSQMHKRSTCLSSIHAPRMSNSSLSSYIIKSPPIAEKARSSRDRILCVASSREANQHPTQFVVCVLLPAQNSLYPQRRPYLRTGGRTCHRSHVKLVLQNLPVQRGHCRR